MNQLEKKISGATQALPHAIIVEDEKPLATAFGIALTNAGYSVEIISNGRDALKRLKTYAPHLLLLDLYLPYVSGDEILDEISSLPIFADTNIFIVTANSRLGRHFGEKVDLVLEKPISLMSLNSFARRYNPTGDQSLELFNTSWSADQ